MLVFDLDDTLYPEREYSLSALKFAGSLIDARFGLSSSAERLLELFSQSERAPIDRLWADVSLPPTARLEIIEAMQAHRPEISLRSDARLLLNVLRARGEAFAIVTDGRSITQRAKLAALDCLDAEPISISEECGLNKTDPRRFLAIEERWPGCTYTYVGDNPAKDFFAPRIIGWQTIMLRDRGANIHSQSVAVPPEFRPARIIDSLLELQ